MKKIMNLALILVAVLGMSGCKEEHVHQYVSELTREATCAQEGVTTYICACGDTYTEAIVKKEHVWSDEVKVKTSPTCGQEGTGVMECINCEDTTEVGIPATGTHEWDEGKVTLEPTCGVDGVYTYTCKFCENTTTEAIPMTYKHVWDEGVITLEPKCAIKGKRTHTCTVCKIATKIESVPNTGGHVWDEGVITKVADVFGTGEKKYICSKCDEIRFEELPRTGKAYAYIRTGTYVMEYDYNVKRMDEFSYKAQADTPNFLQYSMDYQLEPNTKYIICVDVKTENVVNQDNSASSVAVNIGTDGIWTSSDIKGTSDWQTMKIYCRTDSSGEMVLELNMGDQNNKCTGTAWFENIRIIPFNEYDCNETEWNFLFVIAENSSIDVVDPDTGKHIKSSYSMTDAEAEALIKSIKDFEKDLTDISEGKIQAKVTIVRCEEVISDYSKTESGYWISAKSAYAYLKERNIDVSNYDHVTFIIEDPGMYTEYFGLGGVRIKNNIGYSFIKFGGETTNPTEYCYNVTASSWPAGVYVHEFLHAIEDYAVRLGMKNMLYIHDMEEYNYNSSDGHRKFYGDTINMKVYYEGGYRGADPKVWQLPPSIFAR
ncbi:MAG: hypothetical protein IJW18_04490 [Lachnospiraceae bacterium]|nr:hypothetical protein [Lachnospiraceae bacterium]